MDEPNTATLLIKHTVYQLIIKLHYGIHIDLGHKYEQILIENDSLGNPLWHNFLKETKSKATNRIIEMS